MTKGSRIAIRIAIAGGAIVLVLLASLAVWLTFPRTPSDTSILKFQGYISLPAGSHSKFLTVLDYMTVNGRNLFVTNVSTGTVYKIALRGSALPSVPDIALFESEPAAHGVIVDPVSDLAFVTRSKANVVDVFDPDSMKLIKHFPVADDPDGIFYDPVDKLVYVASGDAGKGTLIDPATQTVTGTIALGGKPEFAVFDPATKLLYQTLEDANSIVVIDPAKRSIVDRWQLHQCESPTGIAIDEARQQLFIACGHNSVLIVFDIERRQILASLPIGYGPDSVAFDPALQRIYSTGIAGDLSVIQKDETGAFRALDSIHLHVGAHTLAVDPVTHRLFVGYASLFLPPRIAVFTAVH